MSLLHPEHLFVCWITSSCTCGHVKDWSKGDGSTCLGLGLPQLAAVLRWPQHKKYGAKPRFREPSRDANPSVPNTLSRQRQRLYNMSEDDQMSYRIEQRSSCCVDSHYWVHIGVFVLSGLAFILCWRRDLLSWRRRALFVF